MSSANQIQQYFKKLCIKYKFATSKEIPYPTSPFAQIIGQQTAITAMQQAILYRRHVLLIGLAGTGKSLLAKCAMSVWPTNKLKIISCPNIQQVHKPILRQFGDEFDWQQYAKKHKFYKISLLSILRGYLLIAGGITLLASLLASRLVILPIVTYPLNPYVLIFLLAPYPNLLSAINEILRSLTPFDPLAEGACIYDNMHKSTNFIDATGSNAAAILGDVSHDPYAGLNVNSPRHDITHKLMRVGAVHKAHNGALYIDEIGTLDQKIQYSLLTILEQRVAGIKSWYTNGVQSLNKIPSNFCLIMAGNPETVSSIHSALRSRIKGYGYQIVMNQQMSITLESTQKMLQFISRECHNNNFLPFQKPAILRILHHAHSVSKTKDHYTLELRALKGVLRLASDHAKFNASTVVTGPQVEYILRTYGSLENRLAAVANKQLVYVPTLKKSRAILTMKYAEGLTKVEQIINVLSFIQIFKKRKSYGASIRVYNLERHTNQVETNNKYRLNSSYAASYLSNFIQLQPDCGLDIYLMGPTIINRAVLELDNLMFTIVGQYYSATTDTIYVGQLTEQGFVTYSNRTIELIETALQAGYKVKTCKQMEWLYTTNLKVSYVGHIDELRAHSYIEDAWV